MSERDFKARLEQVGHELDRATTRWTARRRRRRQTLALACAALVVGGAAIAASTELGSNGVEPAAAQVLERAAQVDAGRAQRSGRYFYTETLVSSRTLPGPTAGQEQTVTSTRRTELWAGADGSGVQVAHPEEVEVSPSPPVPEGTSGAPQAAPAPVRDTKPRRPKSVRYRKGTIARGELGSFDTSFRDSLLDQLGLSARQLEQLSANQSSFNGRLLAGVEDLVRRLKPAGDRKQAVDRQAFFLVAGLLGQWGEPMPARLRAALFRFAATLDGIAVDESFKDERGRPGIALSSGDARMVLVPNSYRLRATSYTVGDTETTIETLRTAVVDRPRERPSSGSQPR